MLSDLVIKTTDRGDGPVFERFFAGYDRAFVLPDEKEDVEGFRACLALNHGAEHRRLIAEYGPFRELCLIAEDCDGVPVGGANLIAMPAATGPAVTANLNYIYVEPEQRGRGHLARLLGAARRCAGNLFGAPASQVLVFLEQNDPFRMSEADYSRDTRFTGLDQFTRLRIWAKRGALAIDFPYEQPALSSGQRPDSTLMMSVIGPSGQALDAALFERHLRSFFGVSVLKGAPIEADVCASGQLETLHDLAAQKASIRLFESASLVGDLASREALVSRLGRRPHSMRDALESLESASRRR